MPTSADVTTLLVQAREGDRAALDRLMPLVYDELRRIARLRRAGDGGATLDTTGLVHDAYLRLIDGTRVAWRDRAHFFAVASRAMRFVVVDHARARQAQKRGGAADPLPLDRVQVAAEARAAELVALDDALDRLAAHDARLAEVVELRFFGGLTHDEVAEVTGRSVPTIKRDWARARGWLHRFMQGASPGGPLPP